MCYGSSARPPLPPVAGGAGAIRGRALVLAAADGARFAAHSATHETRGGSGIVILPDIRGLHPFYEELAERFAEAGVHATAVDYFGRTAGVGSGEARGDGFDWETHVARTHPDTVAADTAAAVAHVRSEEGGGADAVFTVGFCFGGRNSFNQSARGHGLAGVIGFYGRVAPRDAGDREAPTQLAPTYSSPVLGLFGGADPAISGADIEGFRVALVGAGVPNELVTYPDAPHSFFDRTFALYEQECADAWTRILRFIERNTRKDETRG